MKLVRIKLVQLKLWFWKQTQCPKGRHWDDGVPANFCAACKKQINPDAYSEYRVTLVDGTRHCVTAVNAMHAKSLLIYGSDLMFDGSNGRQLGEQRLHPDNIKSVERLEKQRHPAE